MPPALRRRIASLEGIHSRFEQMEEEHHERVRQVEIAYMEQVQELFDRRHQIISGVEEPTDEEVKSSAYFEALREAEQEDAAATAQQQQHADVVGVPAFWSSVFRNCETLQTVDGFEMSDADLAVLDYLVDVQQHVWDESEETVHASMMSEGWASEAGGDPGFSIHLSFASNPYLQSSELVLYCSGDYEVLRTTPPVWRERRCDPTIRTVTKKVKKKGGGPVQKKVVEKEVESFFRVFEVAADEDEDEHELLTGDERADGEPLPVRLLQQELVVRLREDVIPRAQLHYIAALHGFDADGMDDDEGGGWEDGPAPAPPQMPPRLRR